MKKYFCLLMAAALLLTGCGGSTPVETEAPTTELVATMEPTTEPTTAPTEPKTFFEEQGFTFWEGLNVNDTQDGGIMAQAEFLNSTECKLRMTSGDREETTYRLADAEVKVFMDEYTLAEFELACNEKKLSTVNINYPSDSLYKAFKEEDSSLTKEAWLELYQDYKVIHCQVDRTISVSKEVNNAKLAMNIGQSRWYCDFRLLAECLSVLNSRDGSVYESKHEYHPGIAETFTISAETGSQNICAVADMAITEIGSGIVTDWCISEFFFVMIPTDSDNLTFVLPLTGTSRTLEAFEMADVKNAEVSKTAWEQKTFAEYTEGKDHLKYYFLSPYRH